MLKPGADPMNVQTNDVLCDFCQSEWHDDLPLVEGHRGSIICGVCLKAACLKLDADALVVSARSCTMCTEYRDDPAWEGTLVPESVICARCINLGAKTLQRDKDYTWTRTNAKA
ncbi:hypothetical protein [Nodularia spumigena]|uniref:hypothetical protein n=1 Tax=Nodularia spumigena TaxID=70799 RepID=UPI002B1FC53F|nr:hypothetical protein [Nodularia spumigena]MEA5556266.1 hypothetical protein [Nodularia spumigena CH309]